MKIEKLSEKAKTIGGFDMELIVDKINEVIDKVNKR